MTFSTFGGLEAMITGLCDEYPKSLGKHREAFVAALLVGIYLCALPTCTYVSSFYGRWGAPPKKCTLDANRRGCILFPLPLQHFILSQAHSLREEKIW